MLITGFDAPVEQVMYLDRKVIAHLLQAVARVNRTSGGKKCGYVVDYIGVARHLNEALKDYHAADTVGMLIDISVELPKLLDRTMPDWRGRKQTLGSEWRSYCAFGIERTSSDG